MACSVLLMALHGCSAGSPATKGPDETPSAGDETAAEAGPPADETEEQRTVRLAKQKRTQCDLLADTIAAEPSIDIIANINDGALLTKVAGDLDAAATKLGAVEVTVTRLGAARDAYVEILQGKRTAMTAMAAAASSNDAKKQELESYQEHDQRVSAVLDQINAFCNSSELE